MFIDHNLCEKKGEPKRNRAESSLLTGRTPYRWAKPAHVDDDDVELLQVKEEPLTFGPNAVPFQTSAKYLGVHLDETLSMNEQVTPLCR